MKSPGEYLRTLRGFCLSKNLADLALLLIGERNVFLDGLHVLLNLAQAAGADDNAGHGGIFQHPGQGKLGHGLAAGIGQGIQPANLVHHVIGQVAFLQEDAGAGEVRLYDILARVSCWCCANKNLAELRNMKKMLPEYWQRLEYLQSRTERPMKGAGKSVFDLGRRFDKEEMICKDPMD